MKILKIISIVIALAIGTVASSPKIEAQSILGTLLSGGKSSGESAGAALRDIYDQYKADGKLDMSNVRTIKNVTVLANSIQGLKGQKITSSFCKDFAKGLVTGSTSLISSKNSTNVTKSLMSMANNIDFGSLLGTSSSSSNSSSSKASASTNQTADALLGALTGTTKAVIPQASQVASSLQDIFKLIK